MQNLMKYYLSTYTSYAHNHLTAVLTSNDVKFNVEYLNTEETFSKFEVFSNEQVYKQVRQLIEEDNGTAISIEYGPY